MAEDDASHEIERPDAPSRALLLCDHAMNRVPVAVAGGDLGLPEAEMGRHIAYDVGARGVTLELSRLMDATALLTRFSRLVIDPNRGEDDPTLVMRLYDGTIVPANRDVDGAEVERRLNAYHRPYHAAIASEIDARMAARRPPALIAVHSFTPRLVGRGPRPWHIGVLWSDDQRFSAPLIARLGAEADLVRGRQRAVFGPSGRRHDGSPRHPARPAARARRDTTGPDRGRGRPALVGGPARAHVRRGDRGPGMVRTMDEATRTEIEAAAFRALRDHLARPSRRREHRPDEPRRLLPQLPRAVVAGGRRGARDRDDEGGCARGVLRHALRRMDGAAPDRGDARSQGRFRRKG